MALPVILRAKVLLRRILSSSRVGLARLGVSRLGLSRLGLARWLGWATLGLEAMVGGEKQACAAVIALPPPKSE